MYYPAIIHEAKTKGYFAAVKGQEIRAQFERLSAIRESDLLGTNLYEWKVVRSLVELKLAVTELIEKGMMAADLNELSTVCERCKQSYRQGKEGANASYTGTDQTFDAIFASVVRLVSYADGIRSDFNALLSDGYYSGTVGDFSELLKKYSTVETETIGDLFPDIGRGKFHFLSVKNAIYAVIKKKLNEVMKAMFVGFPSEGEVYPETIRQYDDLRAVPNLSLTEGIKETPVLFVCTPIREEFDIMLNANLHRDGIERIVQIDLTRIAKKLRANRDAMTRFLMYVRKNRDPQVMAFYGVETLTEEEKYNLYVAIGDYLPFASEDIRLVFWDVTGDMEGLTDYIRIRRSVTTLAPAENRYLRLPTYSDVCERIDSFDEKKRETVREKCVFMGYRGLHLFYAKEEDLGLAAETAKSISERNLPLALNFLEALPDTSKLIPLDWQYKGAVGRDAEQGDEYDYDEIRDVSDDRIHAIIANHSLTIYEKCGELVRYILLADEDKSVWKENLSDAERKKRTSLAVRIIAYTMRIWCPSPTVTFCSEKEGEWGAKCCRGGEEIKIKTSNLSNVEWMMDTILHELYHALQYTLCETNADLTWYKKTYHIANERIASWYSNSREYVDVDDNDSLYELQTKEVDARSFAGYCLGDQICTSHKYEWKKRI